MQDDEDDDNDDDDGECSAGVQVRSAVRECSAGVFTPNSKTIWWSLKENRHL